MSRVLFKQLDYYHLESGHYWCPVGAHLPSLNIETCVLNAIRGSSWQYTRFLLSFSGQATRAATKYRRGSLLITKTFLNFWNALIWDRLLVRAVFLMQLHTVAICHEAYRRALNTIATSSIWRLIWRLSCFAVPLQFALIKIHDRSSAFCLSSRAR
eukprot:scaffold84327_cov32-Prasinocladus_malaysianus.AAC.1